MKVVIIDYGAGNNLSVKLALQRLGVNAVLSHKPDEIRNAEKVIFPGVGHANPAMLALQQKGLDIIIPALQQPVLGICLGMQLMCAHSDEGNTACLHIFNQRVQLFKPALKVPHTGWNTVTIANSTGKTLGNAGWYYFVHSYYVAVNQHTTHTCNYSIGFSASMQKDNFYAVQFHPEKSGDAGAALLEQFLKI